MVFECLIVWHDARIINAAWISVEALRIFVSIKYMVLDDVFVLWLLTGISILHNGAEGIQEQGGYEVARNVLKLQES
jgi:hypothetical protein